MDITADKQALKRSDSDKLNSFMEDFRATLGITFPQDLVNCMTLRKWKATLWSGLLRFEIVFEDSSKADGTVSGYILGIFRRGDRFIQFGREPERNQKLLAICMADITRCGGRRWSDSGYNAAEKV